jgi:hypothetical protein
VWVVLYQLPPSNVLSSNNGDGVDDDGREDEVGDEVSRLESTVRQLSLCQSNPSRSSRKLNAPGA